MKKRLHKPKNGRLYFSLDPDDTRFQVGDKYIYRLDKDGKILILPSESGMTVSRKISGSKIRPLFDLRSQEIRDAVNAADSLEIEVEADRIIVRTLRRQTKRYILNDSVSIEKLVGYSKEYEYELPRSSMFVREQEVSEIFRTISLFSGAGMLDYAFQQDRKFEMVFAIDQNRSACESYRENIGDHVVCGDIRGYDDLNIPDGEVVIGGPSCCPFSSENHARPGSLHPDADLLDSYIRIVAEKNPRIFVIENVPAILTRKNAQRFETLKQLDRYELTSAVVKDSALGGFTKRKRAIIIGSRIGKVILPENKNTKLKTVREALKKVDAEWYNFSDISIPSEITRKKMRYVRPGHNWKDIPTELQDRGTHDNHYRRLSWEGLSPALVNWRKCLLLHPEEDRILSVAEAAALSGLNKDFRFVGSLNDKQQQVGNGVPQAIAEFVKDIVKNKLLTAAY